MSADVSKGPPPVVRKIHKYDNPHAEVAKATVEIQGDEFDVVMEMPDGSVNNRHIDREHITTFTDDPNSPIVENRDLFRDQALIRPVFVPDFVWREWMGYPWPESGAKKPPFEPKVLGETPDELVVEVTAKWVNR